MESRTSASPQAVSKSSKEGRLRTLASNQTGVNNVLKFLSNLTAHDSEKLDELSVDQFIRRGVGLNKPELISALKEMTALGVGVFLNGRHSHPSRFVFKRFDARSIGLVGIGKSDRLLPRGEEEERSAPVPVMPVSSGTGSNPAPPVTVMPSSIDLPALNETVHRIEYPLRHDLYVQMVLPKDFTDQDADRLCNFLKGLPAPRPASN